MMTPLLIAYPYPYEPAPFVSFDFTTLAVLLIVFVCSLVILLRRASKTAIVMGLFDLGAAIWILLKVHFPYRGWIGLGLLLAGFLLVVIGYRRLNEEG